MTMAVEPAQRRLGVLSRQVSPRWEGDVVQLAPSSCSADTRLPSTSSQAGFSRRDNRVNFARPSSERGPTYAQCERRPVSLPETPGVEIRLPGGEWIFWSVTSPWGRVFKSHTPSQSSSSSGSPPPTPSHPSATRTTLPPLPPTPSPPPPPPPRSPPTPTGAPLFARRVQEPPSPSTFAASPLPPTPRPPPPSALAPTSSLPPSPPPPPAHPLHSPVSSAKSQALSVRGGKGLMKRSHAQPVLPVDSGIPGPSGSSLIAKGAEALAGNRSANPRGPASEAGYRRMPAEIGPLTSRHSDGRAAASGEWTPRMDVVETLAAFGLTLELPGVAAEGIRVEVTEEGTLVVSGQRPLTSPSGPGPNGAPLGAVFLRRELRHGPFRASWRIPANVNLDGISAEFWDGVLQVHLPKKLRKTGVGAYEGGY